MNNRLDENFFGIPKEGVAASNNAKGFMGPPDFDDADFYQGSKPRSVTIKMIYL